MRIGYACINLSLAEEKVQVNRGMIKKTFQAKGVEYASELALKNVSDLLKILDWNIANNLLLYRMSSDMFPWMSEYDLKDLPDIRGIKKLLQEAGMKAKANNLRLTYHPGPFNVLATNNPSVLKKTIKELGQHGEIMDLMGLPRSPFSKINIHIGGAFGDKTSAIKRFITNFRLLPEKVRSRLTVENDDKVNMFSVKDLLPVFEETGIPIVFDYLHHKFCTGGWTEKEAMKCAAATWPGDIPPVIHFSSSKKKYEDTSAPGPAHADFVYEKINRYGIETDVMLEAKAKERAALKYIHEHRMKLV